MVKNLLDLRRPGSISIFSANRIRIFSNLAIKRNCRQARVVLESEPLRPLSDEVVRGRLNQLLGKVMLERTFRKSRGFVTRRNYHEKMFLTTQASQRYNTIVGN